MMTLVSWIVSSLWSHGVVLTLMLSFVLQRLPITCCSTATSVLRTQLLGVNVITLQPQSWLSKLSSKLRNKESSPSLVSVERPVSVRHIIYMPSMLCLNNLDGSLRATDDNHFCSLLCDRGYTVHIIGTDQHTTLASKVERVLDNLIDMILQSCPTTTIKELAVIASELSIAPVLKYLNSASLQSTSGRNSLLGAAVFLDPPSPIATRSQKGRLEILKKYASAVTSYSSLRLHLPSQISSDDAQSKWQAYVERLFRDKKLLEFLQRSGDNRSEDDTGQVDSRLEQEIEYFDKVYFPKFDVEREEFLAQLPRRRRRGQQSTRSFILGNPQSRDDVTITDLSLVGTVAIDNLLVGQEMPHRILVMQSSPDLEEQTSTFETPFTDIMSSPDVFEFDVDTIYQSFDMEQASGVWGPQAAEDLAALCQAGSVISVHPETVEEYLDDEISFSESLGMTDEWSDEDCKKHYRMYRVVSEWLNLLTHCGYLSQ